MLFPPLYVLLAGAIAVARLVYSCLLGNANQTLNILHRVLTNDNTTII